MRGIASKTACILAVVAMLVPPWAAGSASDGAGGRALTTSYIQEAVCDVTGADYCSINAIAVGDPDNDGGDEVITNSDWYIEGKGEPSTIIYGWDGSAYRAEDTIPGFDMLLHPGVMIQGTFHIAVGDADNDGKNELMMPGFVDSTYGVHLYKYGSGGYNRIWSAAGQSYEDGEIADIDRDGSNEVLVPGLGVLRWDGQKMATVCKLQYSEGIRTGDADGDGTMEAVLASGPLGITVLGWSGKGLVEEGSASAGGYASAGFGMGDSDGDGRDECWRVEYHNGLVVWGWNGTAYAAEWKGTSPTNDNPVTGWTGDADDDGLAEHFIGNGNHAMGDSIFQFEDQDGDYSSDWNSDGFDMYCHCIAVADSDGDGYSEILGGTGSGGRFYVFEANPRGTPLLKVDVAVDRDIVSAGEQASVDITVRCNGSIEGAAISMESSLGGTFGPVEELGNGKYRAAFTATDDVKGNATWITATASKDGYRPGSGRARLQIEDTVPPVVRITHPAEGSMVAGRSLAVRGTARDNVAVSLVEACVGRGPWTACAGTASWKATVELEPGLNTICARARDGAGNVDQTCVNVTFDATPPELTILSPAEGVMVNGTALEVSGTASDAIGVASVELAVPGSSWRMCNGTAEWRGAVVLLSGKNTVTARATDLAGNVRTATVNVTADIGPPAVWIESPAPATVVLESPVGVLGGAQDDGEVAGVELCRDGGPWAPCSGTTAWSATMSVTSGANRARVRATDRSGRTAEASVEFLADLLPPSVAIAGPKEDALVGSRKVAIRGSASDDAGIARVEVDGSDPAWVLCEGTASWEGVLELAEGKNLVRARATDLGGRTALATINLTVDSLPPVLTVNRPTEGWTYSTFDVAVAGTAEDQNGVSLVELSTDGASWSPCAGKERWTGTARLGTGKAVIRVRAVDMCGNVAERTVNVSVDTTLPVVAITRPSDGASLMSAGAAVEGTASSARGLAKVEVSRDGQNWTLCKGTARWRGTLRLAAGNNTIWARATDLDGRSQLTWVEVRVRPETITVQEFPVLPLALAAALAAALSAFLLWRGRRGEPRW